TTVLVIGSYQVRPHLWSWLSCRESLMVHEVCLEGVHFTTEDDLVKLIPDVINKNQFKINLAQIESSVERHPWVKDTEVYRRLPDKLVVVIHEKLPVALINGEELWAMDSAGSLLPLSLWRGSLNLPLVTRKLRIPERAGETVNDEVLLGALQYLDRLKYRLPALWDVISEVTWSPEGLITLHAAKSKTRIILGSEPNWKQTLKLYSFFLYEGGESGIQDIKSIDLRFTDQVIVKRHQS
ncbi:FtsQ-type POTRA domain-containing protein, partial [bacterium]|nr:FtsQ-type POTRA domain-containing protein [bacterium]